MSVCSENRNIYYMEVTGLRNYIINNAVTAGFTSTTDFFTSEWNRLHCGEGDLLVAGLVRAGAALVLLILRGSPNILGLLLLFGPFVSHLAGTQHLRLGACLAAGTGFHMVRPGARSARALFGSGCCWLTVRGGSGHLILWEALTVL